MEQVLAPAPMALQSLRLSGWGTVGGEIKKLSILQESTRDLRDALESAESLCMEGSSEVRENKNVGLTNLDMSLSKEE